MTRELKILLLDEEWSYALAYVFPSKREQYIHARNIKHHQFCICAAWKWMHETSVYSIKITDDKKRFKKNFRDDFIIALKLHELMTEADVILAHNGDSFDIKRANNLFIKHGLGPIPERKSIDTLKVARKYFAFAGNDLDSLAKLFGSKGKNKKPCWFGLTDGDAAEIAVAARYCMNDVRELEVVFIKLRPYIRRLPRIGKLKEITQCEACGSKRLRNKGPDWDGYRQYRRLTCLECGHPNKGKL